MKFEFSNIGPIKSADLELGDLTIIAGRNNTGKTYLAYTLYGFLKTWGQYPHRIWSLRQMRKNMSVDIDHLACEALEKGVSRCAVDPETLHKQRREVLKSWMGYFSANLLHTVFSSSPDNFTRARLDLTLDNETPVFAPDSDSKAPATQDLFSIKFGDREIVITRNPMEEHQSISAAVHVLWKRYFQFILPELTLTPFVLSAERFGISLFYKELDFTKNQLVDLIQQLGTSGKIKDFSPFLLVDKATSRYALPVKDNIDYTRSMLDLSTRKSELYEDKLFDAIRALMDGYYRIEQGNIEFKSRRRGKRTFAIPLHLASSSARGLSDLYFFLRCVARRDHLLIIDEPESHLDTANQVQLARLLARMVRAGMKVLITTHSDYLIKELNNLVMLSKEFENKEKIIRTHKYHEDDFLPAEKIRAYIAKKNGLAECEVDDFGINMPVFDKTIDEINKVSNDLAARITQQNEAEE